MQQNRINVAPAPSQKQVVLSIIDSHNAPAAAEALKKWDGGRAPRGREGYGEGIATSQLWLSGSFTGKFLKNISANLCHTVYTVHFEGKVRILNNSVFNSDFGRSI